MPNKTNAVKDAKQLAQYFIKEFSDVIRSPFLILDKNLKIVGANQSFYKNFKTSKKETEDIYIYNLGNGQWNIPELRRLLELILPKQKLVTDFEVAHSFPKIGKKTMLLNAHQLDSTKQIILSIEDITLQKEIESKMLNYIHELEKSVGEKATELQSRFDELLRLNKLVSSRGLKMMFLKKQLSELQKKIPE